jgi:hypothetical protein
MIDEVFAIGEDRQAHFAETAPPSCNRVPNGGFSALGSGY